MTVGKIGSGAGLSARNVWGQKDDESDADYSQGLALCQAAGWPS